ncbi:MAG: hypothetical protein WDW38_003709 [Sanguina aurantia]
MGGRTLTDYINWRTPKKDVALKASIGEEWRPPIQPVMYDKPQDSIFSKMDRDPIIRRVLINPRLPPPRHMPFVGHPAFLFFAGSWTGAMLTFVFTCKYFGRKEAEELVKYDPAYFPEYAKAT